MTRKLPYSKKRFLDGEFLFDYYWRVMGTARNARALAEVAEANGMVNRLTKRGPSWTGCWKAMWRWACRKENQARAYEIFNGAMREMGEYYTFEEFLDILTTNIYQNAYQPVSDGQKTRFLKNNELA